MYCLIQYLLKYIFKLQTLSHISPRHSSGPPEAFHTYFYNHAHRLRLEKLL